MRRKCKLRTIQRPNDIIKTIVNEYSKTKEITFVLTQSSFDRLIQTAHHYTVDDGLVAFYDEIENRPHRFLELRTEDGLVLWFSHQGIHFGPHHTPKLSVTIT